MIGPMSAMRHADRTLRAPAGHRAIAALASPVVGYFVARLVLVLSTLPELPVYTACLTLATLLGLRTWTARIHLGDTSMRVHNSLVTVTIPRDSVRRVTETGRVEWYQRRRNQRPSRSLAESLRAPWWTLGIARTTYARNQEEVRSWVRTGRRQPDDKAAA